MEKSRARYFTKLNSKYQALEVFSFAYGSSFKDCLLIVGNLDRAHRDLLIQNYGMIKKFIMRYCIYCFLLKTIKEIDIDYFENSDLSGLYQYRLDEEYNQEFFWLKENFYKFRDFSKKELEIEYEENNTE